MGEKLETTMSNPDERRAYLKILLEDIKALDYLLENNMIEDDIQRIGAEQEFSIVDSNFRPSDRGTELLNKINNPHFTTELAKYNLEINLDPQPFTGSGLRDVHKQLEDLLYYMRDIAYSMDLIPILTGILPTVRESEIGKGFMTPEPRYFALDEVMRKAKGEDFRIFIKGVDEISMVQDSILAEACNTSFQIHLQIAPSEFTEKYNWAQAISGPVLAACTNSPLLLERELWAETRIALFQQSCDIRSGEGALRKKAPRVDFGTDWLRGTISDLFKENVSTYKLLLTRKIDERPFEQIEQGKAPCLRALCLHNGTVYTWNRPCYGVGGGKPHLRIENRYIPSGPSIPDEMANMAFWTGLMNGMPDEAHNLPDKFDFIDAKSNFLIAARYGLDTRMHWFSKGYNAKDLLINELIPLSREGLKKANIDQQDIDHYIDIIEERVASGKTGSSWTIRAYRNMKKNMTEKEAVMVVTKAMHYWQKKNLPVHKWKAPEALKRPLEGNYERVDELMTPQVISIGENDLAEFAFNIMKWKKIRHIPVEDNKRNVVGLLTLSKFNSLIEQNVDLSELSVRDVMIKNPITIHPEAPITQAIKIMQSMDFASLPVVSNGELVGILTDYDILRVKDKLPPEAREKLNEHDR